MTNRMMANMFGRPFPSDRAIADAENAAVAPSSLVACSDCTLPVAMEETESGLRPVDGVAEGEVVTCSRCFHLRCSIVVAGVVCDTPMGMACSHRNRFGDSWKSQRVGRDRRVVRGGVR
jgi:hypothetical protein